MDWQEKYHYREATGKHCCETCDAFKDGTCEMFDSKVDLKMLCDEWTANYQPKQASFDAFVEGIFAPARPVLSFEQYGRMVHQATWDDIVAKAQRLIQSGQVTILRNAPHHLMAHVIGDHGEYNTEISRTDPSSNVIEQWSCECPWDQFAFNRTREWKRFEGRVCSHVLATYWKGKSTPLDYQPDTGPKPFQKQGPPQQRIPYQGPGAGGPPESGPQMQDRLDALREQVKLRQKNNIDYLPEVGENIQLPGFRPTQRGEQPPAIPTNDMLLKGENPEVPFRLPGQPEYQRQELQLFDLSAPPWNPTPVPPQLPVSVPYGDQPDPNDPISGIGFSSIPFGTRRIFMAADDDFALWFQNSKREGRATYAQVVKRGIYLEARGGKHPMPGAEPYAFWPDGTPRYRRQDLGYHPELDQRVNADYVDEQGRQGAPELRGVHMEVPLNSRCEVTDIEPLLKYAHIIVPMSQQASYLEPQTMEGWVSFSDLLPLPDANNPFIRRRGSDEWVDEPSENG